MVARSQSEHEQINAREYPGTRQLCCECGEPTGRCEEDAIYLDGGAGPLCEECYHIAKLRAELAEARQQIATLTAERDEARQDGVRLEWCMTHYGSMRIDARLSYCIPPSLYSRFTGEYRDLPGLRDAIDQAREAVKGKVENE